VFLERAVSTKYVGGLSNHQAQVAQVERDVLESQDRRGQRLVPLNRGAGDLEHRQGHSPLDAPLNLQDLEVKVDRRLELGMLGPDRAKFRGFPGFGPGSPRCARR
jgi:hypothetical protein